MSSQPDAYRVSFPRSNGCGGGETIDLRRTGIRRTDQAIQLEVAPSDQALHQTARRLDLLFLRENPIRSPNP